MLFEGVLWCLYGGFYSCLLFVVLLFWLIFNSNRTDDHADSQLFRRVCRCFVVVPSSICRVSVVLSSLFFSWRCRCFDAVRLNGRPSILRKQTTPPNPNHTNYENNSPTDSPPQPQSPDHLLNPKPFNKWHYKAVSMAKQYIKQFIKSIMI